MIKYTVTVMSIRGSEKMKKAVKRLMTTARFAKLHKLNKRILHYFDEIGLFRPLTKTNYDYRYYDGSQSIDFE